MAFPFRSLVIRTCLALSAAALLGGSAIASDVELKQDRARTPDSSIDAVPLGRDIGPAVDPGLPGLTGISLYEGDRIASRGGYAPDMHGKQGASSAENPREARRLGATFLKGIQKKGGGWGAGTWGNADDGAPADVATSAMVILALHRDADGTDIHGDAIAKGVRYVLKAIDESPRDSARVNTPESTQPQYKLGKLVDTHMAAMMLTELAGTLDDETNRGMDKGLGQVIAKVQIAQRADGSFDGDGWAPVLSNSIAATSLMRAREQGVDVSDEVLDKSEKYQAAQVSEDGSFDTSTGAGVELYSVASTLRTNSLAKKRKDSDNAPAATRATEASVGRVAADADGRLMAGFGSVGGEEMLGYMMISDTLAEEDTKAFAKWDGKVGDYLVGIQNADGSWVGHHCITSTTFTTAAAVMTLGSGDWAKRQAARVTGGKDESKG